MRNLFSELPEDVATVLFPEDVATICFLTALFAAVFYWAWYLAASWKRIRYEDSVVELLTDQEAVATMKAYREKAITGETESRNGLTDHLAEQLSLSEGSTVLQHLQSIFDAGLEGARLEVQQRLSSTSNEIFQDNARLRAILSTFIVIGLLGTLYGLADALATLSADSLLNFDPEVVEDLLGRLETALAPSIWGVFFTVFGVFVYGYYLNAVCRPVQQALERATLDHWVPALYPTRNQQAKETLEQAREQLRDNVEAAERVAQFAERVDEDLQDFDDRISSAKNFLEQFGASVQRLGETTDSVESAMSEVETYQEELQKAYDKVAGGQETLVRLLQNLEERDERVGERLDGLEALEREWRDHLSETRAQIQQVTNSAQNTLESIEGRNEAVVEVLREPIVEELNAVAEKLDYLDESMHGGLQQVEQSLNRLESPVASSADRIERIANTFSDNLHNVVTGVRDEFRRQNDVQNERKDELARLNDNLEELIDQQQSIQKVIQEKDSRQNGPGIMGRVRSLFQQD